MAINQKPCGVCSNCKKLAIAKAAVLRVCNSPKQGVHADQGTLDVWNDALRDFPCTAPMDVVEMNEVEQGLVKVDLKSGQVICGHRRGDIHVIAGQQWAFYDAQAEGSGWLGVMAALDGSKLLCNVPQKLLF